MKIFSILLLGLVLQGYISNTAKPGYIGILATTLHPVTIIQVYHGTPAEKAGLKVKDVIVRVDGDRDGEIKGTPGSVCHLIVLRRGRDLSDLLNKTFEVEVVRAPLDELPPEFQANTHD